MCELCRELELNFIITLIFCCYVKCFYFFVTKPSTNLLVQQVCQDKNGEKISKTICLHDVIN